MLTGHEGPGSLFSELKERNWCEALEAGFQTTPGFSFFVIDITITEEALNHIDEIVKLVFQVAYRAALSIKYVRAEMYNN
jgi:secreted Zn-dependent insulinase-like peptidase